MQTSAMHRIEYHHNKIVSDDRSLGRFTKDDINRPRQILINRLKVFLNWLAVVRDENPGMRKNYDATIAPRPRSHQELMAMVWRNSEE